VIWVSAITIRRYRTLLLVILALAATAIFFLVLLARTERTYTLHAKSGPLKFSVRALNAIERIDRSSLERRLIQQGDLTATDAKVAVLEYLGFLALASIKPPKTLSPPSEAADQAWHVHILDTGAYARDMNKIFGKPFHHKPANSAAAEWQKEPIIRTRGLLSQLSGMRQIALAQRLARKENFDVGALTDVGALGLIVCRSPDAIDRIDATQPGPARTKASNSGACASSSDGGFSDSFDHGHHDAGGAGHDAGHGGGADGGHSCGGSSCSGH